MENYLTLLLATLEHVKLITTNEAEKLDEELRNSTLPSNYKEAKLFIENAFEKIK